MFRKQEPSQHLQSHPQQYSSTALYLGAVSGSLAENLLHPLDTIGKRLQKSSLPLSPFTREGLRNARQVAFNGPLFAGFSASINCKIAQRTFAFGTQPIIKSKVDYMMGDFIANNVGMKYRSTYTHLLAGSFTGLAEVGFLPLDAIKVRKQLGDKRSSFNILCKENLKLYRGSSVTALRNVKASATLFGGSELAKKIIFNLEHTESANLQQKFIASYLGAMGVVLVTSPTDVIKTRLQSGSGVTSARQALKEILIHEGPKALMKGVWPRLFSVGPKLAIMKTGAEHFSEMFDRQIKELRR